MISAKRILSLTSSMLAAFALTSSGFAQTGIVDFSGDQISADESPHSFKIGGQYKNLFTLLRGTDGVTPEKKYLAADVNRIRISPGYAYADSLTLHADFDAETIISNYAASPAFAAMWIPSGYNDPAGGAWDTRRGENTYARAKVHRAYAKYTTGKLTATAGRQQIRFGSGRLWNPLDVLNPITPTAFEGADEQKGTDALRADYFFSDLTELTVAAAPRLHNNSIKEAAISDANTIARFKTTSGGNEAALIGGYISKRATAGIDLSAAVLDGTLRGALIGFNPARGKKYLCAGGGYEYTFKNGIYLIAEFFFNSSSFNSDPELMQEYIRMQYSGYDQRSSETLSNRFLTFNRHYAGSGIGYDIHPLVRGDLYFIADFEGRGIFITPSIKFNARENLDLSASAMTAKVFGGSDKISDFKEIADDPVWLASVVWYF